MGGNNCKGLLPGSSNATSNTSAKTGKPEKYDYVEDVVCNKTDIKENEMKLLHLEKDGAKVIVVLNKKGEFMLLVQNVRTTEHYFIQER